jgi:transcriptional repressor NrdR
LRCPFCHKDDSKVVDSRAAAEGEVIRRRRECLTCKRRFTTYERVERSPIRVVKKDGSRVPFEREKIRSGLLKACYKRPVSAEALESMLTRIENEIYKFFDREVPSHFIGELVMKELRVLDEVSYVRFASVYRDFKDVGEFFKELKPMVEKKDRASRKGE